MKLNRLFRWTGLILSLLVLLLLAYVYLPVLRSPESGYLARKGQLQSTTITRQWSEAGDSFIELELLSSSGLRVQLQQREPALTTKPLPVFLILGGTRSGRNACKLIPQIGQTKCIALNYPYEGKAKLAGIEILTNLRALQQAIKDTPPAVMLALDYVLARPNTDQKQVELAGVSFGAFLMSIPAVLDQRVSRLWLVQGAAEPITVIRHNMKEPDDSGLYKTIMANLGGYAIGAQHVDPAKWVGRMAPRPVIFINAEYDDAMPPESVAALHAAAQQPREIIWTKGAHVTPGQQDIIEQLSTIVLQRIEQSRHD